MNSLRLSGTVISKKIDSTKGGKLVVNVLLCDHERRERPVFKVSLWENDASIAADHDLGQGDVITVQGGIYGVGSNDHGPYIDIRQCKLISIEKIVKTQVFQLDEAMGDEVNSFLQEGDSIE